VWARLHRRPMSSHRPATLTTLPVGTSASLASPLPAYPRRLIVSADRPMRVLPRCSLRVRLAWRLRRRVGIRVWLGRRGRDQVGHCPACCPVRVFGSRSQRSHLLVRRSTRQLPANSRRIRARTRTGALMTTAPAPAENPVASASSRRRVEPANPIRPVTIGGHTPLPRTTEG